MKIMFAVPSFWPSQDGVAHITEYLAEGLASRGHEIFVLTSAGNGGLQVLPETEEHAGVKIERMRIYVQWPLTLKGRDDKSTRKVYREKIREFQPDILVVVCSQTWTLDWIVDELDKIECVKVFYSHGYSRWEKSDRIAEKLKSRNIIGVYEELKVKWYYTKLYQWIRKFECAIYLSELNNSYSYAIKYGLTNGMILENAIEDVFLKKEMLHSKEQFYQEKLQFLYVANYNDNKNQDMLLEAFCKSDMQNVTLHFTGFEENDYLKMLRQHLKEWLPENSTKKVIFHVHLSRQQIYELYRECCVFVSTSKSENCPIVHCEAAACGMAVVSTNVGDVSLKDGIVLINTEKELKEALEYLNENRQEAFERGVRLRKYMLSRGCREIDKIDCLESKLRSLVSKKDRG